MGFIVGDRATCHATDDLGQVRELANKFKSRDIDILGIAGGDGTIHQTLSIFIEVYGKKPMPQVALLRGGAMNNMASQLGINGSPERILSNLILKYHKGEPFNETKINMIRVNGSYGFSLGAEVVERFIKDYNKMAVSPMWAHGAWLLIRLSISALYQGRLAQRLCQRVGCRILIDGRPTPFKNYTMIVIGTQRTLGLGFRVLYRANSEKGRFQILGVSATPRQIVGMYPRTLLARPIKSESVVDEMASHVVLEFDQPTPYSIDGDIVTPRTNRVEITTGPLITCITS